MSITIPAPREGLTEELSRPRAAIVPAEGAEVAKLRTVGLSVHYGTRLVVGDVSLEVRADTITAFIGPSGCGKSTILRSLDRLNDLIPGARVSGRVLLDGQDIYGQGVRPVEVRRRVGMVFQRPNPFPMSIFENVAYGPRRHGLRDRRRLEEVVEQSLLQAALWDEVKGDLGRPALALSGGQQQRLCIARALAVEPDVILMDEPCSSLDPLATMRIEELLQTLKASFTIVIVTHNLQQAARVSDATAFFTLGADRVGRLVEEGPTARIFTSPREGLTADYVAGRFG
ncbi:MAG TPA: phosphate ABC transporter ATP-binding protein PstB [Candidatus Limnocylindrales bacterium]|nr:phosphate ABC transporter ATP-binding protein PstB [Candidatus Limnocylindrales bacterium]